MSEAIFTKGAAPATPDAGRVTLYAKTDGRFYFKDETGVEIPLKATGAGTGDLLADGTVPLTADWDVGAFKITAQQLESDIATGTAPLVVASTTLVSNLNADLLDGNEATAFATSAQGTTADSALQDDGSTPLTANWDVGAFDITAEQFHSDITTGTAPFTVASTTVVTNLNADKIDGADLIDEDNMASDSAVHVPTQQSVKAYVDASGGGGAMTSLGTATVAGAAATTLTLGSLDLSAYTAFQVFGKVKNAVGSAPNVSLYFNADTTAANYHRQLLAGSGGSAVASRANDGVIFTLSASSFAEFNSRITSDLEGKPRAITETNVGSTTGILIYHVSSLWVTAANVTSITLSSATASSLDIGTTFTVYGIT